MFPKLCLFNKTSEVLRDFRSLPILLLAFGLSACASLLTSNTPTPTIPTNTPLPPTATPPPSVAIVNGEFITVVEFQAELGRYKSAQTALGKTVTEEDANKIVLEDFIAQALLAQSARGENFEVTESDLTLRMNALGSADSLSAWQSAHGYDSASFKIALKRSAEAAWMRDKIIAEVPQTTEQIHLRQILTYNADDANVALDKLNNGADFNELAKLYDPLTLGELGWLPRGYLLDAKAEEAAFALQVGAYSAIIPTDAGYHIFKVVERGEHLLSPDALLSAQELALKKWLEERRAASDIVLAP